MLIEMSYFLRSLGGRPELWADSELIYKQLQPLVLLCYLERSGEKLRLDVANAFWPDLDKQERLARLSESLRLIEHAAPGAVIKLDDENKLKANVSSDVQDLSMAIEQENYDFVLEIYRGHYLQSVEHNKRLKLFDTDVYDWLLAERETMLDMTRAAILDFAEIRAAQEHFDEAAKLALKAYNLKTEQSFLLPQSYQRIYTLLCAGQETKTLRTAKEAIQLYDEEAITLHDDFQAARRQLATANNLPQVSDALIGRQTELEECAVLLRGDTRLLCLIGPPGIGKTAFSKELTRNLRGYSVFKDGIYALWLEQLASSEDIVAALALTLNLQIPTQRDALNFVAEMIAEQAILLYLDNFEHLLEATHMLDTLFERCPNLKIVLSTREVVTSDWSHLYSLEGLAFPNEACSFEDVLSYAAIELFVDQGEKVNSGFALTEENCKDVIDICQQVKGLALAVKLAASWLSASEASTISEELKQGVDLLDDIKINQRGISASLELSWERLSPELQKAFTQLVVFNGGFTLEAAKQVCDIKLTQLRDLQNKSLIEWDAESKRYCFHPLIRKYAELKVEAVVLDDLRQQHSKYYLKLLRVITDGTQEERNQAVSVLKPEIYNVQDAWNTILQVWDLDELQRTTHSLERFFDEVAAYSTGSKLLQIAIDLLNVSTENYNAILSNVMASQAWLQHRLQNYDTSIELAKKAMQYCDDHFQTKSTALNVLGSSFKYKRDYSLAKKYYEEGLRISQDYPGYYATVLSNIGSVERDYGNFELSEKYFVEALEIRYELNQLHGIPYILNGLGTLKMYQNEFTQAVGYLESALKSATELDLEHWIIQIKGNIYYLRYCLGQFEGIELQLEELILHAKQNKRQFTEVTLLIFLIRVLIAERKFLEALNYIERCINIHYQLNFEFKILELIIVFAEVSKYIDSEVSHKINLFFKNNVVLENINYIEKTQLDRISEKDSILFVVEPFIKDKLNQILLHVEKWIDSMVST